MPQLELKLPWQRQAGAAPDGPSAPTGLPEPDQAWQQWNGSRTADDFHKVMKALEPTVAKGLTAFGGGRAHLKTKARLLAADAVRTYDPAKANKAALSTYVYGNLQRLNRVAADREAAVRMPERNRTDAILLRDAVAEHVDRHGFEPDLVTLSERTGLSPKRIQLAGRAFREIGASGLDTEKGDTLLRQDADAESDPWVDYVYFDLDPKSRKIFEWTTGHGGSKVLAKQEIAKRLGLSPAAVSARIGSIVKRMEERPAGDLI